MGPQFRWTCSYQGCAWFQVCDDTGTYEIELRHRLEDYERACLNGGPDGAYAKECARLIGYLVPRYPRASPLPLSTVAAFNAWQIAECKEWVRKLEAEPERYGVLGPNDELRSPRYQAKGCAFFRVIVAPTKANGYRCEGEWVLETLPERFPAIGV